MESDHNHLYCLESTWWVHLKDHIPDRNLHHHSKFGSLLYHQQHIPDRFSVTFLNNVQEKLWKFDSSGRVWHFPQSNTTFAVPRQNLSVSMGHCIGGKKHKEDIPILWPDSILNKPGPRLSPSKLIWVYSKSVERHTNICADTQQSKAPLLNLPWKKASRQLQIKHQGCQVGNFEAILMCGTVICQTFKCSRSSLESPALHLTWSVNTGLVANYVGPLISI